MDYRDDDERGRGWCPSCGREATGITVAARGMCEVHGWVFVEFTRPDTEEDGMASVDRIALEGEEDGFELVVEATAKSGREGSHRFNVHGIATTGELREQLTAILTKLDEWEANV